jgi:Tetratricopeptide repeat.
MLTMKTKKLLFFLFAIAIPMLAGAQMNIKDPKDLKYGNDSITRVTCLRNLSLYGEFVKQGNFHDAKKPWVKVFTQCPAASLNTYINGAKIYKDYIDNATDPSKKSSLLDTLMLIYDRRIENFGRKGYVIGRKAMDFIRYYPDSLEAGYKMLNESVSIDQNRSEEVILGIRFQVALQLYAKKVLGAADVLNLYTESAGYLTSQLAANPNDKSIQNVKETLEQQFAASDVASCENLVNLFGPKFKATPDDLDQNKKIVAMLSTKSCKDQLLYEASEKVYSAEPSADAAYNLGKMFETKGDYTKAIQYYKQAISMQTEAKEKSKILVILGVLYNRELNDKPTARNMAYDAIKVDPTNGYPYILLGNIYTGVKNCGDDDFAKQAIYWLIVDKYQKAKQVDPSLAPEVNKLIETYSQYFPRKEDIFFHGMAVGQSYTIGCWINESTTVR